MVHRARRARRDHLEVGAPGRRRRRLRRLGHPRLPVVSRGLVAARGPRLPRGLPTVLPPAPGAASVRVAHPHLRAVGEGARDGGRHRRDPPAVRQGRLAGRTGQAPGHGGDAGVRGLGRQGGAVRADRRRDHEPLRRPPPARRQGPAPPRDLRGRGRVRGGLRHAGLGRPLRHRGPVPRPHRVPGAVPLPRRGDRGPPRLRDERPDPGPPRGHVAPGTPDDRSARRSCSGPSSA